MRDLYVMGVLLTGLLLGGALPCATQSPGVLMNPNFEWDNTTTNIPTGWKLWGAGWITTVWSAGGYQANISSVPQRDDSGLYQLVDAVPGRRYRLSADSYCGNNQTPVSLGLAAEPTQRSERIAWSSEHNGTFWSRLSVELAAAGPYLAVYLRVRNVNESHIFFEGNLFDNVRLEDLGASGLPTPTVTPSAAPTRWAPNNVYAVDADLRRLAYSFPGTRTALHASTAPAGLHPNADYNNYLGTVQDGGNLWYVLHQSNQPGAIRRIWMTSFGPDGLIRIYLDNPSTPAVDTTIRHFLSGSFPQAYRPLASRNSGAWAAYMPMPYRSFCRVQVRNAQVDRYYWHVTYQDFDQSTGMPSFPPAQGPEAANLARIERTWTACGADPKPTDPNAITDEGTLNLAAGQSLPFWTAQGIGRIDQIWIDLPSTAGEQVLQDLWISAYWDEEDQPSVHSPLGIFFGTAYQEQVYRALLFGMTPVSGYYSFFPMPFHNGARLVLTNQGTAAANNLRYRIVYAHRPATEPGELRFCTSFHQDNNAGAGRLYVPLTIQGAGHFCGIVMGMERNSGDIWSNLEGDEHIFVDGETTPSLWGTGTEDYFNCGWYFFDGKIDMPLYGCTERNTTTGRISAYRLHTSDYIPFRTSFVFGIEVGDAETNNQSGRYRALSFYYIERPVPPPSASLLQTW